jgi:hypothetical protein
MNISIEDVIAGMNLRFDIDGDRATGTDNDNAVLAAVVKAMLAEEYYLDWNENLEDEIYELAVMLASGRY